MVVFKDVGRFGVATAWDGCVYSLGAGVLVGTGAVEWRIALYWVCI